MSIWQIDLIPWYCFFAYFAFSTLRVKPNKTTEDPGKRVWHIGPMIVAALLLFSQSLRMGLLGARFVAATPAVQYLGIGLTFLGAGFAIWARYCLGRYWSARVTLKVGHQLIRSGPYRYIRHPLYTGILVGVAGTALVVGEWRAVVAGLLALISLWRKAWTEELLLSSEFGEQYAEYRQHTGFLTPRFRG